MSRIVAAPWFLLLLAASGAAIDSNRSLLSVRDVETIRAAKAYAAKCTGSATKVGRIHTHVYHIYDGGAGYGLQEHNAGDSLGDLGFIFPRGFQDYYKGGYISTLHVGVTHWGKYLRCNHASGSKHYSCQGGGYAIAGREKPRMGWWYSFPAAGKNKHWWESDAKSGACAMIRISAKCLFNKMAEAGGRCPHGCDSLSYSQCEMCVLGMSTSHQKQVWDHAIWNGGCKHHLDDDLNATSEVQDEVIDDLEPEVPEGAFANTSRSEAPRAQLSGHASEAQAPDDSFTNTTTASTDKGLVIV